MTTNNLNDIYKFMANKLINIGSLVGKTIELQNVTFTLTDTENSQSFIITSIGKKPSIKYLLAENIWYASGSNSVDFIGKFAKKWLSISDDGKTSNSAYGYIIKKKFGFNQIDLIVDLLKKDPQSRRACIIINDANENVIQTLDEQCTMFMQFYIRDDCLNATVCMRSNDMIYGLPYDVPAFIAIQQYIAHKLGIRSGNYTHFATSLHCYFEDVEKLQRIAYGTFYVPKYKIDFVKLYKNADVLYERINNGESVLKTCREYNILIGE